MPKRFAKSDWIEQGLEALTENGPDALTVERLCLSADKTRGSFYFHFENIEAFMADLVNAWKTQFTTEIINRPHIRAQRADLLNQLAARLDLDLEVGVRNLALRHSALQPIISEADQMRIDWLANLYVRVADYDEDKARALAKIEYASFIGFKIINPDLKPSEAKILYDAFLKLTNRV
ncbi:MAG: TetR/AcrR family transcriptional regulator [Pseudomonadota bacterium]